jgi:thiol:disulfide interchange protein DsbA
MRSLFSFFAAVSLSFIMSGAQAASDSMVGQPYRGVTPYDKADETTVIEFFKFDCPYCRNYHALLSHWGESLPRPLHFRFQPVLEGDAAGKILNKNAVGYLAFKAITASSQNNSNVVVAFMAHAYDIEQDTPGIISNPNTWADAASASGADVGAFEKAWGNGKGDLVSDLRRQQHYALSATPSLVVCGKYVITPDNTSGNDAMFMQLANAVVSKCLIEKGISPK